MANTCGQQLDSLVVFSSPSLYRWFYTFKRASIHPSTRWAKSLVSQVRRSQSPHHRVSYCRKSGEHSSSIPQYPRCRGLCQSCVVRSFGHWVWTLRILFINLWVLSRPPATQSLNFVVKAPRHNPPVYCVVSQVYVSLFRNQEIQRLDLYLLCLETTFIACLWRQLELILSSDELGDDIILSCGLQAISPRCCYWESISLLAGRNICFLGSCVTCKYFTANNFSVAMPAQTEWLQRGFN